MTVASIGSSLAQSKILKKNSLQKEKQKSKNDTKKKGEHILGPRMCFLGRPNFRLKYYINCLTLILLIQYYINNQLILYETYSGPRPCLIWAKFKPLPGRLYRLTFF